MKSGRSHRKYSYYNNTQHYQDIVQENFESLNAYLEHISSTIQSAFDKNLSCYLLAYKAHIKIVKEELEHLRKRT